MDYKRLENTNLIGESNNYINSELKIFNSYQNPLFNLKSEGTCYISQYSNHKKIKRMTLFNIEITKDENEIIESNKNNIKITNVDNSFEIDAEILKYYVKEIDDKHYLSIDVYIYKGQIVPKGKYKIFFDNYILEIKPLFYKIKEYYEDWCYTTHHFSVKKKEKIYLAFGTALMDNKIDTDIQLNKHKNGSVYLFEQQIIEKEGQNIKDLIEEGKFIKQFDISEVNEWNKYQYLFISESNDYLLVKTNNINKSGLIIPSLINKLIVNQLNEENLLYNHKVQNNFYSKYQNSIFNFLPFFLGLIIGKYLFLYRYGIDLKKEKKKYTRIEAAYKYFLKEKYNL